MWTSRQILRVITSLSPVRILTFTPLSASAAMAVRALSLGGSRNAIEKGQIAFVGDRIGILWNVDRFVSDRHHPEPIGIEPDSFLPGGRKVGLIELAGRAIDLVTGGDCEDFLDRALADEDVLVGSVRDNDR